MLINLPYRAEYTTNIKTCKTCRRKIEPDAKKIGFMQHVSSLDKMFRILFSKKREISSIENSKEKVWVEIR